MPQTWPIPVMLAGIKGDILIQVMTIWGGWFVLSAVISYALVTASLDWNHNSNYANVAEDELIAAGACVVGGELLMGFCGIYGHYGSLLLFCLVSYTSYKKNLDLSNFVLTC